MVRVVLGLLLASVLAVPARAEVQLGLRARLGAGYNSNIYLDAAALPAEGDEVAAPLLSVGPGIQVTVGSAHQLTAAWEGQWRELFADQRESMLEHQASLGYTSAPFGGFRVSLLGALHQLHVQEAEGVGWVGGWGTLAISRPLGYAVRASLGYTADYDQFASGAAAEWELAHRGAVALTVRLAPGLVVTPGYTFSFVQAEPEELRSTQHLGRLDLRWDLPWIPLALGASYGFTALLLDSYRTATGGPGGARSSRRDLLHAVAGEAVVTVAGWLDLFARYDGILGFSNQEPDRYARHQATGGVAVRWGTGSARPRRRPLSRHVVQLELRAPDAARVAVVGDFNGWDPEKNPLRREGPMWRTNLQLDPGRYQVMLWVDGELRPPPACPSLVADGFGGASCTITVD